MSDVDTDWFEKKISESPYGSLRRIAKYVKTRLGTSLDHSSLHKTLHGTRTMQLHEARQLADLLGQPMSEIIRRAGVPFGRRDNLPEDLEFPVLIRKKSSGAKRA